MNIDVQRIGLDGVAMRVAVDPAGLIYLLLHQALGRSILVCFDLEGKYLWDKTLPFPYVRELKVAADGSPWLGYGNTLAQIGPQGVELRSIQAFGSPEQELGTFLLATDGYYVCSRQKGGPGALLTQPPQVAKLDLDGGVVWSMNIPVDVIAYAGLTEVSAHTNWKPGPSRPWQPDSWVPNLYGNPLLLAGHRLLASYMDYGSGIGKSYCIDAEVGTQLWMTKPYPLGSNAIAGREQFLVGGARTELYDGNGSIQQSWSSVGYLVLTNEGQARMVEMRNVLPSPNHFTILHPDGTVQRGPHLASYYTAYPVIGAAGITAFWRHGELILVDQQAVRHVLYVDKNLAEASILSRMLLVNEGTLVFAIDQELWIIETELGPLGASSWPCQDGNVQGNPVFSK